MFGSKKVVFIFLTLFAFFILFYNLGKPALDNWDEAWYGEVTKQILRTKDFIALYWNGEYFFEKPPLYMWLSALFSSLFGFSEFSLRFTSALSGLLIIVLVLFYSHRKWGFLPSLFAFATLAFNNVFIWRARSGNIDLLATFLVVVSYFIILSNRRNRYFLLGLVFGFLYLTKESLVIFPFLTFILYEILSARKTIKKNLLRYVKLFSVFIFIPSFWLFLGYLKLGSSFIASVFIHDQRAGNVNISQFHLDYFWYAYYSLQRRYFYVFLIGIFFILRKITPMTFLILAYSLGLLIPLSFAERNNNWYLIPSMPFWSLTIAFGIYKILNFSKLSKYLSLPLIILVFIISYKTFTVNIVPILNTTSSLAQKESGSIIKKLAAETDVVVRLDHLYPATIFYSDRKILASPYEADTRSYFISRKDLASGIKQKKFKWVVGTNEDIDKFLSEYKDIKGEKVATKWGEAIIKIVK